MTVLLAANVFSSCVPHYLSVVLATAFVRLSVTKAGVRCEKFTFRCVYNKRAVLPMFFSRSPHVFYVLTCFKCICS